MNKDAGLIGVETVKENEDGSADYVFHFDAHARSLLAEEGLKLVLYCAAAGLDIQVVYDFIQDHIEYEKDEYKFGDIDDDETSSDD
jgi:hypothetical protein